MDANCIFCSIASGKVPSRKVYEDDSCMGVLDINPAARGHILLLPKKHVAVMPQLAEDEAGHMFMVAKGLSNSMLRSLKVQGTNIFIANGAAAGQRASHLIIHIIPRREDDGLGLVLPEQSIAAEDLQKAQELMLQAVKKQFPGLETAKLKPAGVKNEAQPGIAGKAPVIQEAGAQEKHAQADLDLISKILK